VDDSDEFKIADVTCLVGKNESGKTALLKSLHKLKPDADTKEAFVPDRDYPKRKWRPDTKIPEDPPAIATKWELKPEEIEEIELKFGKGVITGKTFSLKKGYDNVRRFSIDMDESVIVKGLVGGAGLSTDERKLVNKCKTVNTLKSVLSDQPPRSSSQEALLQKLAKEFPKGGSMAVIEAVEAMVPTFLYFDDYLTLPGEVSISAIVKRKDENSLTDKDEVFLALLSLAGTTVEAVRDAGTFENFNAALRAVSNKVTDMIFRYWSQNKHLDVQIRADHARPNDPAPLNAGWICRTRIENKRHRADTSFDERSRGFVWFFSFLIWFYQLKKVYGDNLIILLDEPGLSLHARAQHDLLRYIEEQLRPHYQVVYTTHSPFMINPDDLLSARTVEDVVEIDPKTKQEALKGTKVGEEVLSVDPDTISPLQRALDYEITQTLFIGWHTLLVEGESDILYIRWFSRQCPDPILVPIRKYSFAA